MNMVLLLLASSAATGQTFVVTNKMPRGFTVVNKCADPFSIANKRVVKQSVTTQTVITTRAAQGHTHTCARCGTTWDHAANPTHNCANCGAPQYVIDRSPRPVTVRRTIQVPVVTQPVQRTPPVAVTLSSLQRSNVAYQNCGPSG